MSEDVKNATNTGELLTLNQIANITGGHYQTVKKIIDKYVRDNVLTESLVYRKNRPFTAYSITNTQLAEIQIELQNIKKNSVPLKMNVNDSVKISEKHSYASNTTVSNYNAENDTAKMIDNVKIYEVVKQNNELENQIKRLQAEYKDLEVAKAKEIATVKEERMKFETELYKVQSDIKLIEDKSKTMESAYAEQKLEVDRLNKVVHNRNVALIILGAIILIVFTVAGTLTLFR